MAWVEIEQASGKYKNRVWLSAPLKELERKARAKLTPWSTAKGGRVRPVGRPPITNKDKTPNQ